MRTKTGGRVCTSMWAAVALMGGVWTACDDGGAVDHAGTTETPEQGSIAIGGDDPNGGEGSEISDATWDTRIRLSVLDTLTLTEADEDGFVAGFDLDGLVSDGSDAESCYQSDFTSPDGTPGVDNQLATLTPLFDQIGLGAFQSFVQAAIEEGGLLLMWQIDGFDDAANDDEITLTMRLGIGTPLLGTDGKLLSGQTFDISPTSPDIVATNARIEEGILHAGPFDTILPVVVFGVLYELPVERAFIRAELTYDGGFTQSLLPTRS